MVTIKAGALKFSIHLERVMQPSKNQSTSDRGGAQHEERKVQTEREMPCGRRERDILEKGI